MLHDWRATGTREAPPKSTTARTNSRSCSNAAGSLCSHSIARIHDNVISHCNIKTSLLSVCSRIRQHTPPCKQMIPKVILRTAIRGTREYHTSDSATVADDDIDGWKPNGKPAAAAAGCKRNCCC